MVSEVQRPAVKARIKLRFKTAESFIDEYSHNISQGGLFIRTSKPCNLREKVEIVLIIPEDESEIIVLGEVVSIVPAEQARDEFPAGMGIQILELKEEDQKKIENFISSKLKREPDPESMRAHARVEKRLRVRFESREALSEEYAHNISQGGIFIATSKPQPVGESITIVLIHPETGQELLLHGDVARVVPPEDAARLNSQPGMGIKFRDLVPPVMAQIDAFIRSEINKATGDNLIIEKSSNPQDKK
jgi:type IV pilus assembly protein PilZ